ncbi:DUF4231 domain-containing protein [Sinorhizobium medicae]|uniref:DUF4231 domain-containing protein n=1 Tax=Sinorhizobium medicae TaxID=110321 RepID=UPI000FD79ED0|nr:DUF4231 domain-containing protein [Sinorhizobium medicae]RVJ72547.1 DUF4231 domain-containing protein [Sinorhizobium medicae]
MFQEPPRNHVSQPSTSQPAPTIDAEAYQRKHQLVEELATHADWYDDDSRSDGKLFVALTLATLIGSVVTSLIVAVDFANQGAVAKALVVGLPLLTGLFTTVISQFHVHDLWKLREIGRIDAMMLREKVRALPTAATDVEMRTALLPYQEEKYELERRQALAFFEYLARQQGAARPAGGTAESR